MNQYERSKLMTARLMAIIASEAPAVSLDEDVADAMIRKTLGISEALERVEENRAFFQTLRDNLRCLSASIFEQDPYLRQVKVSEPWEEGRFTLTTASYAPGELFGYDMPMNDGKLVVPRLGYAAKTVRFPAIYEGVTPWMSVCPSEMNTVGKDAKVCAEWLESRAHHGTGLKVLVLGLGLGYFPFLVQTEVSEASFTIVEESPEIISLFTKHLLPQFPSPEKIRIVRADAIEYLNDVRPGEYDYLYADIWQDEIDGAEAYLAIQRLEARLPGTHFAYWIEKEIKTALEDL